MRKFIAYAWILPLLFSHFSFAQIQGNGGTPPGFKWVEDTRSINEIAFPKPDVDALKAEDALVDGKGIAPWRFGAIHYTQISPYSHGEWISTQDGGAIWQLKLSSPEALTMNLAFENTIIPEGNELYVYNEEKSFILGAFTQNHVYEGQLGTELLPGSVIVVEYYVPAVNMQNKGNFTITKVVHGYRSAGEFQEKAFGSSGNCNMNVACPDGSPWADQIRSAVMLVSGSNGFCSGALINNTLQDGKPYVLTANHCYSNPATWIFRFNWQSPTCANPSSSPSFQSLSGAVLRSRRTPSDFCLVEITGGLSGGTVPASYNAYFSGWNNGNAAPSGTVSIHHPSGDIKKISFDDNAASAVQAMGSSEAASSWQVVWDRNTTTEGGSSGSPLFDQNYRIIGQLWGGSASCSNQTGPDYYGRLFNSWNPTGSNSTNQLKHWLDPNNTGATTIDGYDPNAVTYSLDAQMMAVLSPTGTACIGPVNPQVTIKNNGTTTLTSANIIYRIDAGAPVSLNWTGSLASGASTNVNLATFSTTAGTHSFTARISSPNGGSDQNALNDSLTVSFTLNSVTPTALPIAQGFESTFVPAGWQLGNPDGAMSWAKSNTVGFNSTASAWMNNFAYNGAGQLDYLISPTFSLTGQSSGSISFDVAYARYSNSYSDGLKVEISNDCGATWTEIYNKTGGTLATAPNTTSPFVPTASQWRSENIDLTPYANQAALQIRFVGVCGYGNNLYLDNINIQSGAPAAPVASFTPNSPTGCVNSPLSFTNTSSGVVSGVVWTFTGGNPTTSTANSPSVSYASPGSYPVVLTVTGPGGTTVANATVTIYSNPTPSIIANGNILSTGSFNSYQWYRNGAAISGANAANYTITQGGAYTVRVTDANGCVGTSSAFVSTLSEQENLLDFIQIFPNPTDDILFVRHNAQIHMQIALFNALGQKVYMTEGTELQIPVSNLASGIYLIEVQAQGKKALSKVIVK